jgi:hypothetical protein
MNHDGSGTLTETVKVLPRAVRLLKGYQKRTGRSAGPFSLLSADALQRRTKALGQVTLQSKSEKAFPDGSLQIQAVYAFKDVNKITLHMAPTFRSTSKAGEGQLYLKYSRINPAYGGHYVKNDQLTVKWRRYPSQKKYSSPSVLQEYRDVTPVFQDMLKDFSFVIQVQAPDDLETFDDKKKMITQLPYHDNILTVYRADGKNVVGHKELIRSLVLGEVGGRNGQYWGGQWKRIEKAIPGAFTPYATPYGGLSVRFHKSVRVPRPGPGKKKK